MSKLLFTSSRHASSMDAATAMGLESAAAADGVPQDMWDTSSALRDTLNLNGYDNIQKMLWSLGETREFMSEIDKLLIAERERAENILASIRREAAITITPQGTTGQIYLPNRLNRRHSDGCSVD